MHRLHARHTKPNPLAQPRRRFREGSRRSLCIETLEPRLALSGNTVDLTIYIDGSLVDIPANIGVFADGSNAAVFTTASDGLLHLESPGQNTLPDFFNIWRTAAGMAGNNPNAVLTPDQVLTHVADTTFTLEVFVDGAVVTDFENYLLQGGESVSIVYSANPVVSLVTNFGPIIIELFESQTPGTVDNFLNYVNDGDYINSFFHRSVRDFVIQAGGFRTTTAAFINTAQFTPVPTDPPIANEPGISNVRGTVAMAKLGGDPHSATSQFFVNLSDANTFLDLAANGAFTVFGRVVSMNVVDTIADLPINRGNPSPFGELPVSADGELAVITAVEGQGRISGVAFVDANNNGIFDAGEALRSGAIVYVDSNGNGVLDDGELFTTTDADGQYLLQLAPGQHTIRLAPAPGASQTFPAAGAGHTVTVEIGRRSENVNFGLSTTIVEPGDNVLSGFVYLDTNRNGARDANELGVPGVLVTLTGVSHTNQGVMRTALTADSGAYRFDQVPAGTYEITQSQPAALSFGSAVTSVPGATVSDNRISGIVLSGSNQHDNNNFSQRSLKPQHASIAWFFASTQANNGFFRETIARAEELAGNGELAAAIRAGATTFAAGTGQSQSLVAASAAGGSSSAADGAALLAGEVDAAAPVLQEVSMPFAVPSAGVESGSIGAFVDDGAHEDSSFNEIAAVFVGDGLAPEIATVAISELNELPLPNIAATTPATALLPSSASHADFVSAVQASIAQAPGSEPYNSGLLATEVPASDGSSDVAAPLLLSALEPASDASPSRESAVDAALSLSPEEDASEEFVVLPHGALDAALSAVDDWLLT